MPRKGGLVGKLAPKELDPEARAIAERVYEYVRALREMPEVRPLAVHAPLQAAAEGLALAVVRGSDIPDTPENRVDVAAYLVRVFVVAATDLDMRGLVEWRRSLEAELKKTTERDR